MTGHFEKKEDKRKDKNKYSNTEIQYFHPFPCFLPAQCVGIVQDSVQLGLRFGETEEFSSTKADFSHSQKYGTYLQSALSVLDKGLTALLSSWYREKNITFV